MVQRLEGDLRDLIKNNPKIWYIKLQVNILAHTNTVSDFLILTPEYNYAIECKECRSNIFTFDRLTQLELLIQFENKLIRNKAYILICFWKNRRDKSSYFLINITEFIKFKSTWQKKSMNLNDAKNNFKELKYKDIIYYII